MATTTTWSANDSRSWRDTWGWRDDNNDVYQGQYQDYGLHKGLWFVADANIRDTLAGQEILSVRVRMTRYSSGGNSAAGTARIRTHAYSSQPSGEPNVSSVVATEDFAWGDTKWVTLPNSVGEAFKSGSARGIALFHTSDDPYMIFEPTFRLEITYEPEVTAPSWNGGFSIDSTTASSVSMSWNTVSDADHYRVKRSGGPDWTTTNTSFTNSGLNSGTTYTYRVRAENSAGNSSWSNWKSGTTNPATPGGFSSSNITSSSVALSWNSVTGADTYRVQRRKSGNSSWSTVRTQSGTSWTNTGLASGIGYEYRLRAENSGGNSGWTSILSVLTKPATPGGLSVDDSTTSSADLSWNSTTGADSYDIQREGGSTYNQTGLTRTWTGLEPGTKYRWRVRAKNSTGASSWSSYVTGYTIPAQVQGLVVTASTSGSVAIEWDSVSSDHYEVERNSNIVGSEGGTSFLSDGLTPETNYQFRVRAVNAAGAGAWSSYVDEDTETANVMDSVFSASVQLSDGYTAYLENTDEGSTIELNIVDTGATPSVTTIDTIPTNPGEVHALKAARGLQNLALVADGDDRLYVIGARADSNTRVGHFQYTRTADTAFDRTGVNSVTTNVQEPTNFTAVWCDSAANGGAGRILVAFSSGRGGTYGYLLIAGGTGALTVHESANHPNWLVSSSSFRNLTSSGLSAQTDSFGGTRICVACYSHDDSTGTHHVRLATVEVSSDSVSNVDVVQTVASEMTYGHRCKVLGLGSREWATTWVDDTDTLHVFIVEGSTVAAGESYSLPGGGHYDCIEDPTNETLWLYTWNSDDDAILERVPFYYSTSAGFGSPIEINTFSENGQAGPLRTPSRLRDVEIDVHHSREA